MSGRARAADDFDAIHARILQLRASGPALSDIDVIGFQDGSGSSVWYYKPMTDKIFEIWRNAATSSRVPSGTGRWFKMSQPLHTGHSQWWSERNFRFHDLGSKPADFP